MYSSEGKYCHALNILKNTMKYLRKNIFCGLKGVAASGKHKQYGKKNVLIVNQKLNNRKLCFFTDVPWVCVDGRHLVVTSSFDLDLQGT